MGLVGGAEEVGGRLEKSQDEVGPGRNQSLRRPQGLEQHDAILLAG